MGLIFQFQVKCVSKINCVNAEEPSKRNQLNFAVFLSLSLKLALSEGKPFFKAVLAVGQIQRGFCCLISIIRPGMLERFSQL